MFQFSINKNFFLQALNTVKRAISTKNAIPILSTLKIEVAAEGITLIGSNGQISIENFISIDQENAGLVIDAPGSLLLEANFFINVVSSLPSVELDLKEIENHQLILKSGKSEITLKGKDSHQYPRIQEVPTTNPLLLETKALKELISETAFAASSQESRPILTGVHFVLNDQKQLKTVATDSHRLSQKVIQLENVGDHFDVVIPSRSLKEFTAVFDDSIETVEVYFAHNQMLFSRKLPQIPFRRPFVPVCKIPRNIDRILLPDPAVPEPDQSVIHLRYRIKGAIVKTDHILMSEMQIRCIKNHWQFPLPYTTRKTR